MSIKRFVKQIVSVITSCIGTLVSVGVIILSGAVMVSAGGYTFTDLGVLPGGHNNSSAASINNSGQIVGWADSDAGLGHYAAIFSSGTVTRLGGYMSYAASINNSGVAVGAKFGEDGIGNATLFNPMTGETTDLGRLPETMYSRGNSINDAGQAVGFNYSGYDTSIDRAVLFSGGNVIDLGSLPGAKSSWANDINNSGQAVGWSTTADNGQHATLFDINTGMVNDLSTLPGFDRSVASRINDQGKAVGSSYACKLSTTANVSEKTANLYNANTGMVTDLENLPGYDPGKASSVSARGQMIGSTSTADNCFQHATLFDINTGEVIDLGTVPGYNFSQALSINNSNQIVGSVSPVTANDSSMYRAVIFSNGNVTNLNDLVTAPIGSTLTSANDINDAGQIVGTYKTMDGTEHAYLLTPNFDLTISKTGNGSGTVNSSPDGVSCGSSCSAAYSVNTPVTLTATADNGSHFTGWSGDCAGTASTLDLLVDKAKTCIATFARNQSSFTFLGFFPPVNSSVLNEVKAGRTIPVKWQIFDQTDASISDPASFVSLTSYAVACTNFSVGSNDAIEEVTSGNSELEYLGNGNWQYNWKTPKNYSESGQQCRMMVLNLKDGSEHTARFKLTK